MHVYGCYDKKMHEGLLRLFDELLLYLFKFYFFFPATESLWDKSV